MTVGELIVTLGLDSSKFNKGLDEAKSGGISLGNILKSALSFAGGMAIWDGIKSGIKNSIGAGIEFNATMQQNEVAFTTMLGSAQKAHSLMTQLLQMAAKTPFETSDLTQAAQTLMSFGVTADQVMPTIKMLGDVSQGDRDRFNQLALAFAQIQANGRLTGQDLLQLVNAGFNPLKIISERTGKSMAELRDEMSKGQISAQDVANAFKIATSAGGQFYNAMQNQSGTFNGLMSTLKDNLNITFGTIMKPIFDWLTNTALPKAIDLTNKFSDGFQSGGLKGALEAIFPPSLKTTIDGIFTSISNVINFIKTNGGLILSVIAGIVGGMTALRVATLAVTAVQEVQNAIFAAQAIVALGAKGAMELFAGTEKNATLAQTMLNAAMNANPIAIIVTLLAGLTAAVIYLWNTNEGFRNSVVTAWNAIATTAQTVWNGVISIVSSVINSINGAISSFNNTLQEHQTALKVTAAILGTIFGPALIQSGVQAVMAGTQIATSFIANVTKAGIEAVTSGTKIVANFIASMITAGIQATINGAKIVGSFVASLVTTAAQAITTGAAITGHLVMAIVSYAAEGWKAVAAITAQTAAWIAQKAQIIISTAALAAHQVATIALTGATTAMTAAQYALNAAFVATPYGWLVLAIGGVIAAGVALYKNWDTVKQKAYKTWNAIKSAFSPLANFASKAFGWGRDMINGFINGIKSMINSVVNTAKNVANTIRSYLHFSVPDTGPLSDADTYGSDFMELYAQSMLKGLPAVQNAANIVAGNLSNITATPKISAGTSATTSFNDGIAQAVYQAIIDAFRIQNASQGSGDNKELVVRIDMATSQMLARIMLPMIIREGQRQGLNLVVQPQGVSV